MVHLISGALEGRIHPTGAELISLKHSISGLEYMWQADPAFWGKCSPVLFPIVGGLRGNTYIFDGKSYILPRHGFAREKVFSVEQAGPSKAIFTLRSDESSREVYPFDFVFQLIYTLTDKKLYCTYSVQNPADTPLWFSVGGHPAFKVPLMRDSTYEDHYLQFNVDEKLDRWHLQDGLISDRTSPVPAASGRLTLHPSLFYEDALVLKHLESHRVLLGSTSHAHGLDVDFSGFPYLGIWAAKDAPFVCIEPWCGHADTVDHNQLLVEKPGIEKLDGREQWERTWSVEIF